MLVCQLWHCELFEPYELVISTQYKKMKPRWSVHLHSPLKTSPFLLYLQQHARTILYACTSASIFMVPWSCFRYFMQKVSKIPQNAASCQPVCTTKLLLTQNKPQQTFKNYYLHVHARSIGQHHSGEAIWECPNLAVQYHSTREFTKVQQA